jgi:hypothetical protein
VPIVPLHCLFAFNRITFLQVFYFFTSILPYLSLSFLLLSHFPLFSLFHIFPQITSPIFIGIWVHCF